MDRYSVDKVNRRADFVQYMYLNTVRFPMEFECFVLPIAAYDREGKIVRANKYFRELAGISEDDVQEGRINFYECLNHENAGLVEAALGVFENTKKVVRDVGLLLRPNEKTDDYQLSRYPNAIFFPMTYKQGDVECGAVLLDWGETDDE
jgi:PAS domain-containing protein